MAPFSSTVFLEADWRIQGSPPGTVRLVQRADREEWWKADIMERFIASGPIQAKGT